MRKLAVVLVNALIFTKTVLGAQKTNIDCDHWAVDDGECVNNPRFMWDACQSSCMTYAKDDEEICKKWAEEGECTNNPRYVQIHCPDSCSFAAGWNPWARRALGLVEIKDYSDYDGGCGLSQGLFGAAETIRKRLSIFLSGSIVKGFTDTAPSEFHGMAGLAEAVLYAAKLYHPIATLTSNTEIGPILLNLINNTNGLLGRFDGDKIMRSLGKWLKILDKASEAIVKSTGIEVVTDSETACIAVGPTVDDIPRQFYPRFQEGGVSVSTPRYQDIGLSSTVMLSNGVSMPVIGLGTWQLEGQDCEAAVEEAIQLGYRHFDSAQAYRNEAELGAAIRKAMDMGLVTRDALFLATKISDEANAGYDNVKQLISSQLVSLQTHYIDLYMLHSPISDRAVQAETWRALEELYEAGVIRALGVSNFDSYELRELHRSARIKPVVVQNKYDIYHVGKQIDTRGDNIEETCQELGVKIVAYSSLSAYPFTLVPHEDPIVKYVAVKNNITPAQTILRWTLQRGTLLIPRSSNPQRLAENLAVHSIPPFSESDFLLLSTVPYLISSEMHKVVS